MCSSVSSHSVCQREANDEIIINNNWYTKSPWQLYNYYNIVIIVIFNFSGHLSVNVSEELVINTLVAFNNLSYHVESLNEFHTIEKDLVTGQT